MRALSGITAILLTCSGAWASTYTPIRVEGTRLMGLPARYTPAELDLQHFRIRVGHRMRQFDLFLESFFEQPYDLQITALLARTSLPPHLRFHIAPRHKPWHYEMCIALDTLQAVALYVVLHDSPTSESQIPVALDGERETEHMWIKTVP